MDDKSISAVDRVSKLPKVTEGNLYKLEGSGLSGDAGANPVIAKRTSFLYQAPLDLQAFHINGWLTHRKRLANTVDLKFLFAGKHVHDVTKSIMLSEVDFEMPYGGEIYYGGDYYSGTAQENRLVRRSFEAPGQSNAFQIEAKVEGTNEFAVPEVGVRYDAA